MGEEAQSFNTPNAPWEQISKPTISCKTKRNASSASSCQRWIMSPGDTTRKPESVRLTASWKIVRIHDESWWGWSLGDYLPNPRGPSQVKTRNPPFRLKPLCHSNISILQPLQSSAMSSCNWDVEPYYYILEQCHQPLNRWILDNVASLWLFFLMIIDTPILSSGWMVTLNLPSCSSSPDYGACCEIKSPLTIRRPPYPLHVGSRT